MKLFGFSVLGIAFIFVAIGMFFTIIKPRTEHPQTTVVETRQDMVIGTASHLDFTE